MDARHAWLRFGLTIVGSAIGGFGLSYLIAALWLRKAINKPR